MLDVHGTIQELSVKFKNIQGYSNEKFKNISATYGNLAPAMFGYVNSRYGPCYAPVTC